MQATVKQEKTGFLGLMLVSTHKEIVRELKYDHATEVRRLRKEADDANYSNVNRGERIAELEMAKSAVENDLRLANERIAELEKPASISKPKRKTMADIVVPPVSHLGKKVAVKVPVTGKVEAKTGAVKKKGAAK